MYPQFSCRGVISSVLRKDIWKKIAGLAIQKVCAMSRDMFSSIFISAFLSLAVVGIYNNYFMIMNALTGLMLIVVNSINGAIGNTVATVSVEENYKILQKFNCMFMWISTIVAVCLFATYQPFMQLWMGKEYMFEINTVILLTLYFYVLRMGDIRSIWVNAVGLFWEIRWRAILEATLNLVLGYIFIKLWGVNGLLIGTLTSLFFINFIYSSSITFKYYFGYSRLSYYYLTQLLHLIIMVLSCCVVFYICKTVEESFFIKNLWLIMIERMIISFIVSNFILFVFLNGTKDYKLAVEWIKAHYNKSK
jgi:O-antigen/teichoic acid export membrane protein